MLKSAYSDEITKFATLPQAIERYKVSRHTVKRYAKECGALIKLGTDGRVVRVDVTKLDKFLESFTV